MMMTLHSEISTTDTEDGRVLLDERAGRYFQLNPSGALTLGALLHGADIEQAARLLTHRYATALSPTPAPWSPAYAPLGWSLHE